MIGIKRNDIKIELLMEYNFKKDLFNSLLLDEEVFKVI